MTYFSVASTILPLCIYFFIKGKTLNLQLKVLLFYLIVSFSADFFASLHIIYTNYYLINGFTFVEFLAILFVFELQWNSPKLRPLFITIAVVFMAYFLLPFFSILSLGDFYAHINTFKALVFIIMSIVYFSKLTNNTEIPSLTEYYFFWFNTALLIYFSIVLSLFLVMNYITAPGAHGPIKHLWIIHNFAHVIYNCLLAVGLLKWKKATQSL